MDIKKTIQDTYYLKSTQSNPEGREATIKYQNGQFVSCSYNLGSSVYTVADWEFLGQVSEEVLRLEKEYSSAKK